MAFGFPSNKGVKKGMRQNNGAKRNITKLRPVPAKEPKHPHDHSQAQAGEEEEEEEGFTYQDDLKGEQRPLQGSTITVSGCGTDKRSLMQLASELGAKDCASLTSDTTHLIADAFGSAKCDMALKCSMNIMSPQWLHAVRDAWRNADKVDFAELEDRHRLPALTGCIISLTQFARGTHESEVIMTLEAAGARVESRLTRETTHLVVASHLSGHEPNTSKLEHALRTKELPGLKIVWEGWTMDAIRRGGRTNARDDKWRYRIGKLEPRSLEDDDINPIVAEPGQSSTAGKSHWGASSGGAERKRPRPTDKNPELAAEGSDENAVVVRRKRAKIDNDPLLASMSIKPPTLVSSNKVAPASTSRDVEGDMDLYAPEQIGRAPPQQSRATASSAQAGPSRLGMEVANHDDTFSAGRQGTGGGSIIKALSSTRWSRFDEAESSKPRKALVPRRSMDEAPEPHASAQDDSAFFEGGQEEADKGHGGATTENEDEDRPDPPIFGGLTFSLMSMSQKNRQSIRKAVEERKGCVLIDSINSSTDHIVVEYFGAPREYIGPHADPRVVTGCWIESCIHEDRLVPFDDRLLERPLPYETPIEGADKLKLHLSGFSDIEKVHLKRFIRDIGGEAATMFDRSCSHLLHGDAGKEGVKLEGLKAEKANEWGIPVESGAWLRDWAAKRGVIPSPSASYSSSQDRKGKSKEKEAPPRDITNEDPSRRSRSRTTPSEAKVDELKAGGCLADCVVFFSSKISGVAKGRLVDIVTKFDATIASSLDSTVTHLIYSSTHANDTSTDVRMARDVQAFIVHPQWVLECGLLDERANELEFPHTLDPKKGAQLAVVATSPVRSRSSMSRASSAAVVLEQRSRASSRAALVPQREMSLPVPISLSPPRRTEAVAVALDAVSVASHRASSTRRSSSSSPHAPQPQQPAIVVDRQFNTSSEPPGDDAINLGGLETQRVAVLQKTTSLLLAQLAEDETKANASRSLGRRRSHVSNASTKSRHASPASPPISRSASSRGSDLPRRIPGAGHFESTQYTQGGEETYAVEYDDPAEAAAREALALALGAGPAQAQERTNGSDEAEEEVRADEPATVDETPGRATRASARKRKIDQSGCSDGFDDDSFELGRRAAVAAKRGRGATGRR